METLNTRTQEFVGTIRKCPNCGAIVEAFQTRCSSCDFELNNVKSNNAVEEFFRRIENFDIEQAEKDAQEEAEAKKANENTDVGDMAKDFFKNVGKQMFVSNSNSSKKAMQIQAQGLTNVSELAKKKAQFIKDFVVPVDKGSLFEFMSLAISQYDSKMKKNILGQYNDSSYLNESWKTKIREVYTKCVLAFDPNSSEMQKIEKIMTMLEDNSEKKEKNGKASVIGGLANNLGASVSKIQESATSSKKKHGCLFYVLIVFGVMILFGVIGLIFLKSGDFDSVNKLSTEIINQSTSSLKN